MKRVIVTTMLLIALTLMVSDLAARALLIDEFKTNVCSGPVFAGKFPSPEISGDLNASDTVIIITGLKHSVKGEKLLRDPKYYNLFAGNDIFPHKNPTMTIEGATEVKFVKQEVLKDSEGKKIGAESVLKITFANVKLPSGSFYINYSLVDIDINDELVTFYLGSRLVK